MREVTCGNCFKGNVDPKHTRDMHKRYDDRKRLSEAYDTSCTVEGCDCLGWTAHYPGIGILTPEQAERLVAMCANADEVIIRPATFDLPDGYIIAEVRYSGSSHFVQFGIAADGRASS